MIRIKDVAQRAGVSSTTVSHVLNKTRAVDPRTRSRVLAALEELGYRPNALARSLRRQETLTIGIVVHDIAIPFFTSFVKYVEGVAQQAGYSVILCNSGEDSTRLGDLLEVLAAKRVDGLIVAPVSAEDSTLVSIEKRGTPVVYLGQRPAGTTGPTVGDNSADAAAEAVQHLIEDGHVRIGVITGRLMVPPLAERMAGYRRALERHNLPFDERLVRLGVIGVEHAASSMRALLELSDPPTAVFTTNLLMTTGALSALHEARVRCPQEMAIVGFDDHELAGISQPPLTTVRQHTERMATTAAQLLLECMRGKTMEGQEVVLPAELVVRGSCSERCLEKLNSMTVSGRGSVSSQVVHAETRKLEEVVRRD